MSTKKRKRRKGRSRGSEWQHKSSIFLVSIVLLFMGIVLSVASISLHKKNEATKLEEAALEEQKAEQLEQEDEIDELEEYRKSDEAVKDIAKEKCGLREQDEVLIKPKK